MLFLIHTRGWCRDPHLFLIVFLFCRVPASTYHPPNPALKIQVFSVPAVIFLSEIQGIWLFAVVSVSSACFPAFEDSLTNFKQSKNKEKTFSSLMPEWQVRVTGRRREGLRLCKGILLYTSITRAQAASTSAPHLPRYQNTSSPDKLERVRARCFLTSQVSVTFLSSCWFFTET